MIFQLKGFLKKEVYFRGFFSLNSIYSLLYFTGNFCHIYLRAKEINTNKSTNTSTNLRQIS
jgi:hypothetical protein